MQWKFFFSRPGIFILRKNSTGIEINKLLFYLQTKIIREYNVIFEEQVDFLDAH